MDMFGFSPAAFALSLDQRLNMAVGTNQGPALEMTPEVIPRTIPAVAGRHGSRSDFSINSYEAQSVPYHVTGLLCLHCVIACPAQAWSCSPSSFLLVTMGRWHPFRGRGGLTSASQLIPLLPAR